MSQSEINWDYHKEPSIPSWKWSSDADKDFPEIRFFVNERAPLKYYIIGPWTRLDAGAWCNCGHRPFEKSGNFIALEHRAEGKVFASHPFHNNPLGGAKWAHQFAKNYELPHIGSECRDHHVRIFLARRSEEDLWIEKSREVHNKQNRFVRAFKLEGTTRF